MSNFETILMISIFCLGLREITDDIEDGSRIGYPLRKWFIDQTWMPLLVSKPIILCCACMASFWGSIIYWSLIYYYSCSAEDLMGTVQDWGTYAKWAYCCISASFINTFFWTIRNKLIGL